MVGLEGEGISYREQALGTLQSSDLLPLRLRQQALSDITKCLNNRAILADSIG